MHLRIRLASLLSSLSRNSPRNLDSCFVETDFCFYYVLLRWKWAWRKSLLSSFFLALEAALFFPREMVKLNIDDWMKEEAEEKSIN